MLVLRRPIPFACMSVVCVSFAVLCIVAKQCKVGIWCVEVEEECEVYISVVTTFNPLFLPKPRTGAGVELGDHNWTLNLRENGVRYTKTV